MRELLVWLPKCLVVCQNAGRLRLAFKATILQRTLPIFWGNTEAARRFKLRAGLQPEASAAFKQAQGITWVMGITQGG